MTPKLFLIGLWVLTLSPENEFSRRTLEKPKPHIPTSERVVSVGEASVIYDPRKEVYVFTYPGYDGKPRRMYFELRTKVEAVVEGSVAVTSEANRFVYQYTLHNFKSSRQGLGWFVVTTRQEVSGAKGPDSGWHVTELPTPVFPEHKGVMWSDSQPRKGIPPPPVRQASGIASGVPPGASRSGFSFESQLLPGIVFCFAQGWGFTPITYGEPPPEVDKLVRENTFLFLHGKTVGPVLGAHPEDPENSLTQLLKWLSEAQELGWVNDPKVAARLASRLEAARSNWQSGNKAAIEETISDVIAVAERERGVGITSELYAILKFNAEALLSSIDLPSRK